jgi:hypothetical protein
LGARIAEGVILHGGEFVNAGVDIAEPVIEPAAGEGGELGCVGIPL